MANTTISWGVPGSALLLVGMVMFCLTRAKRRDRREEEHSKCFRDQGHQTFERPELSITSKSDIRSDRVTVCLRAPLEL